MKSNTFPLLLKKDLKQLDEFLSVLKMDELKKSCRRLGLPDKGKKKELMDRIMTFITSGDVETLPVIPEASKAKNHPPQKLHKDSLMLYGSYKNDAKTRAFFKELIGKYFAYTAFGIDWLNECWLKGDPPTYQEFAEYWVKETERRKTKKAPAKEEWALFHFAMDLNKKNPNLSMRQLMDAWQIYRTEKSAIVMELLEKAANKLH